MILLCILMLSFLSWSVCLLLIVYKEIRAQKKTKLIYTFFLISTFAVMISLVLCAFIGMLPLLYGGN